MAGDWIKMRTDLYRDPKVTMIADLLLGQNMQCDSNVTRNERSVMRNATVGALLSVWGVVRHQGHRNGDDLSLYNVPLIAIDDMADMVGFGEALVSVGWIRFAGDTLVFPRFFAENNTDPTDAQREGNRERQRRYREKKQGKSRNVTGNVTVTPRVEKSRVEKSKGVDVDADALKNFDWTSVSRDANRIAKTIPAQNRDDRDLILKAICLAQVHFSQDWLWDSVEAVRLGTTRKNKAAHFHSVLASRTKELGQNFNGLLKQITVPEQMLQGNP